MRRAARLAPVLAIPVAVFVGLFVEGWGRQNTSAVARDSAAPETGTRTALPAPQLSHQFLRRFKLTGIRLRAGIPVLAVNGAVDSRKFEQLVVLLSALGYRSVSADRYAGWYRGKHVRLPRHPFLLTFDDGRLDSWRAADAVLRRYNMRATMFIVVGATHSAPSSFYLDWADLRAMRQSERWDIQFHAGNPRADVSSWYSDRTAQSETFPHYRQRVSHDILSALQTMAHHGYSSPLMAVPYHDGRACSVCDRWLASFLGQHFVAVFDNSAAENSSEVRRYPWGEKTSLDQLYRFLVKGRASS